MARRKKAPTTLLREANKRIEELENELKIKESVLDSYRRQLEVAENEIAGVHVALDALSVPRFIEVPGAYSSCSKKEMQLASRLMQLASRLFAWVSGVKTKTEAN